MSSELSIYKNNRINELRNLFNSNVARLNNTLSINVRIIQNNRRLNRNQNNINGIVINNRYNEYKTRIE